jgi:type I restriction enzyme S subunit
VREWPSERFGDVLRIVSGRNQREVASEDGPYPIYGSGGVMGRASSYICPAGTTIVGRKGSINRPIFVEEPLWNVDTAFGLVPADELDTKFLYYFALGYDFGKHNMGTTIPSLVKTDLLEIRMPLPSLAEQQRIVAILDEAFDGISAIETAEHMAARHFGELLDAVADAEFRAIKNTAKWKTLSEVSKDFGRGKSRHRPRNDPRLYGGDYPFVQTGDVRNSDGVIGSFSQTYNDVGLSQSKLWPRGTLCVTIAANIAEVAVLDLEACFPDSIIGVVCDPAVTSPEYLLQVLRHSREELQAEGKGSAQDNINLRTFETRRFPFPRPSVQAEVVERLDAVFAERARLASIYSRKLALLGELKRSLLHEAFSGNL